MPEKILTCLTCPAITACATPAAFRILMHLPRWPSETQCRSAPASRAAGLQLGKGFLLDGDDGDVVAETAGALQREEGKPAVAGDEAYAGHRFGSLSNGLGPSRTDASV